MTNHGTPSVTIIGGGASGVLLAAHLLRDPDSDIRVTLLERRGQYGQGVAYSASQRANLGKRPLTLRGDLSPNSATPRQILPFT